MSSDFWNARYATEDYIFGTAPNVFLASQIALIQPGMQALAVADGEGRNGVWLAEQGARVHAVDFSPAASKSMERLQADPQLAKMGICMVKTHLSLSDNPTLKGVPTNWRLTIREVLTYGGAGFIVPVAGAISLMPGTSSNPAFKRVDVDVETGKVKGVF